MNTKYSPAPWRVTKCSCGHATCNYHGTSNGSFPQGAGYSLEDARLIAASPKLLAALAGFVAVDASFGSARIETLREMAASGSKSSLLAKAVLEAREAIAEATGGNP